MSPLVSVIMPCYNAERYVKEAVQSVFDQTLQSWELIVVDDGSTDGSAAILRELAAREPRMRVITRSTPSGSPAVPRNEGTDAATGQYIAFLDSDDRWLPDKLMHQCYLMHTTTADIVYSNYEKTDARGTRAGRVITAPETATFRQLMRGNYIACSTLIYNTYTLGKRYFPQIGHEDFCCWLSMLRDGYVAYNTNTVEMLYRISDTSVSHNKLRTVAWTWHILRREQGLPLLTAIYCLLSHLLKATMKKLN